MAWAKVQSPGGSGGAGSGRVFKLLTVGTSEVPQGVVFGIMDGTGDLYLSLRGSKCVTGSNGGGGVNNPSDGSWHHVAITWGGTTGDLRYVIGTGTVGPGKLTTTCHRDLQVLEQRAIQTKFVLLLQVQVDMP